MYRLVRQIVLPTGVPNVPESTSEPVWTSVDSRRLISDDSVRRSLRQGTTFCKWFGVFTSVQFANSQTPKRPAHQPQGARQLLPAPGQTYRLYVHGHHCSSIVDRLVRLLVSANGVSSRPHSAVSSLCSAGQTSPYPDNWAQLDGHASQHHLG